MSTTDTAVTPSVNAWHLKVSYEPWGESEIYNDSFTDDKQISSLDNTTLDELDGGSIKLNVDPEGGYTWGCFQTTVKLTPGDVRRVFLDVDADVPEGTSIHYYLSEWAGEQWTYQDVTPDSSVTHPEDPHVPSNYWAWSEIVDPGRELKLSIEMESHSTAIPVIHSISLRGMQTVSGEAHEVKLIDEPDTLSAVAHANYITRLTWEPSTTSGVTYNVYRSETPYFTPSSATLIASDVTTSYYDDNNQQLNKQFYYKVTVAKDYTIDSTVRERESVPSNEVSPEIALALTPNVNYATMLKWNAIGTGTTYEVYRRTAQTQPECVATGLQTTYWYDSDLKYGNTFYYKIKAVYQDGSSKYSEEYSNAVVSKAELDKAIGAKPYWSQIGFGTGSGSGQIQIASGNVNYQRADFSQSMPGMEMVRAYNSQAGYKTALGTGWDFDYNMCLLKEFNTDGSEGIALKMGDGTLYRFAKNTDGTYARPTGVNLSLTYFPVINNYAVMTQDHTVYTFNAFMRLTSISDANGNTVTLTYDNANGNLISIKNDVNTQPELCDQMTFTYTEPASPQEPARIATVTDASGRVYHYEYDTNGKLTDEYITMDETKKYGEHYGYNEGGTLTSVANPVLPTADRQTTQIAYTNGKATTVTDALSEPLTITYTSGKTTSTFRNASEEYNYNSNMLLTSLKDALDNTTTYSYDDNYNCTQTQYHNDVYQKSGETESLVDTTITNSFVYDADGNLLQSTRPDGKTTYYTNYNAFGEAGSVATPFKDVDGTTHYAKVDYTYDTHGNLTGVSGTSEVTRATDGSYTTVAAAIGPVAAYTYDSRGCMLTETETVAGISSTTTYEYNDTKHRLTKTINPDNSYMEQGYDTYPDNSPAVTYGDVAWTKDGEGNLTKYEYDLVGRPTKTYNPDGTSSTNTHDIHDKVLSTTLDKGNDELETTGYEYDALGRVTTTTYNDGTQSSVGYSVDTQGNITTTCTDSEGVQTCKKVNPLGWTIYEDSDGIQTYALYDKTGNCVITCDTSGYINQTHFNKMDKVVMSIDDPSTDRLLYTLPGGFSASASGKNQTTTFDEFDLQGNALSSTDEEGVQTVTTYDVLSRPTHMEKTKMEGGTTQTIESQYAYDESSNGLIKSTVTDGLGHVTEYQYDKMGRLKSEIDQGDPNDGVRMTLSYDYDNNGNLTSTTRNDGSQINNTYDSMNRITEKRYSTDHYISYEYDDKGNLTTMTQHIGTEMITNTYGYNDVNQKIWEQRDGAYIAQYEYTDNRNLKTIKYPQPDETYKSIGYAYDSENRLASISDTTGETPSLIRQYAYDDDTGRVSYLDDFREFDQNGSAFTRQVLTYNSTGTLLGVDYRDENTTSKESYILMLNDKSWITQEAATTNYGTTNSVTKDYTYDAFSRLESEIVGSDETDYTYDNAGNRTQMTKGSDTWTYTYSQFNQLTEIKKNDVTDTTFNYDDNGNLTSEVHDGYTLNYEYDDAGRLTRVERVNEGEDPVELATYKYDGNDQRTEQTVDGITTKYYYDGLNLLYTEKVEIINGTPVTTRLEENIIEPDGSMVASKRFGETYNGYYFFRQDIRGSVTNIVDSDGDRVKGYTYDAYGNTTPVGDANFVNSTVYTGAVEDTATGLIYMNARYYNPQTGIFLTQDSYRGSANEPSHLYAYCSGDPVNNIDTAGYAPSIANITWSNYLEFLKYSNEEKGHYRSEGVNKYFLKWMAAFVRDHQKGHAHITWGYRTPFEQACQYHKWYVHKAGNYTAYPGESWHEYGIAVDFSDGSIRSCASKSELSKYYLIKPFDRRLETSYYTTKYLTYMNLTDEPWHVQPSYTLDRVKACLAVYWANDYYAGWQDQLGKKTHNTLYTNTKSTANNYNTAHPFTRPTSLSQEWYCSYCKKWYCSKKYTAGNYLTSDNYGRK